ncbi:MAG: hypothetical protein QM708_14130 [Propioniciclava sp.]|uniref:hypothetical protein n=1 Tax=Propioniciclava sp. TaxID=2038686 RepID=UPI0039E3CB21
MAYPSSGNVDAAYARLLTGFYGPPRRAPRPSPRAVGLSIDTGADVLPAVVPAADAEEYVVERGEPPAVTSPAGTSPATAPAIAAEGSSAPVAAVVPPPAASDPAPDPAPPAPVTPSPPPPPGDAAPDPYSAAIRQPEPAPPPPAPIAPVERPVDPFEAARPPVPSDPPAEARAGLAESDLAADMQAILTGQKIYDPATGAMRERQASPPPPPPPVEAKNEQAIFDRIAESMAYAQAYDLGTVELQRRFDSFDQALQAQVAPAGPRPSPAPPAAAPATVGQREFIRDLSAIEDARRSAEAPPIPVWSHLYPVTDAGRVALGGTVQALGGDGLSRPFFDTGEHVRAGDEVAVLPLNVGGVPFSYGDLIAMGDFFDGPDGLLAAAPEQLQTMRTLIRRSADHYRSGSGSNPNDAEWQRATGGIYLTLAKANYDHFSPASLMGESFAQRYGDNRARYRELHQRALAESQRLHLAHPNATPSLESALIVNAFADHFLTDAFAAGHLVNKEVVMGRFRAGFYDGSTLTREANEFFGRVAERAFRGEVKAKFSVLEQYDPSIGIGGVGWHANINTVHNFTELLRKAAAVKPDEIANLAVKSVHDHLNKVGVAVRNAAGAAPWTVHGDGHLDPATLAVMRQAVAQSVANLSDPGLLASGVDLSTFVERVWAHTPVPTPDGLKVIRAAVDTYTSPTSAALVDSAAALITDQVDQLISELLEGHHLRRA